MPFKKAEQKFSGKINECVIGVGDAAVTLGGEKGLPFLSGEGNAPVVGVEILDSYPEDWEKCLVDAYGDVVKDPAAWAKYVQDNTTNHLKNVLKSLKPSKRQSIFHWLLQAATTLKKMVIYWLRFLRHCLAKTLFYSQLLKITTNLSA